MEVTLTRSELWADRGISFLCGFGSSFVLLLMGGAMLAIGSTPARIQAKVHMLNAMNTADDDARWRLKQMAEAVKVSPLQTMDEIRMYESMGAFPAERNQGTTPPVNVSTDARRPR